jgi:hypothetical protein
MSVLTLASSRSPFSGTSLWILIALNLLMIQIFGLFFLYHRHGNSGFDFEYPTTSQIRQGRPYHPLLDFPLGPAVALPSVRVEEQKNDKQVGTSNSVGHQDNYYGGKGDKQHLGGFANNDVDMNGVSPATWKLMIEKHGIKSLLDVGCGRGVSTSWFHMHGVDAKCVEGSHDAWEQSLIPNELRTEHDFSRGYVE